MGVSEKIRRMKMLSHIRTHARKYLVAGLILTGIGAVGATVTPDSFARGWRGIAPNHEYRSPSCPYQHYSHCQALEVAE